MYNCIYLISLSLRPGELCTRLWADRSQYLVVGGPVIGLIGTATGVVQAHHAELQLQTRGAAEGYRSLDVMAPKLTSVARMFNAHAGAAVAAPLLTLLEGKPGLDRVVVGVVVFLALNPWGAKKTRSQLLVGSSTCAV